VRSAITIAECDEPGRALRTMAEEVAYVCLPLHPDVGRDAMIGGYENSSYTPFGACGSGPRPGSSCERSERIHGRLLRWLHLGFGRDLRFAKQRNHAIYDSGS
jgi:hypothetical protein